MVEGGLKGSPGFSHISSGQTLHQLYSPPLLIQYIQPPPIDSAYDLYIWTACDPNFLPTPSFVETPLFEART